MSTISKEQKEIARLKKDQTFHQHKNYLIFLVVILTIVYIVDELTSSVRGVVDSFTICDLFNTTFGTPEYDRASSTLGLVTTGAYLIYLVSPFYKSLADRFGRRLFLVINTLGMGVGMLVSIISGNVGLYLLGCVIMTFFTPNDVQVLYIMECAPKEHRAKICSITKGIALISVSLLGVFVNAFVKRENPATWRLVYIVPIILAFVIGIAAIFFVKETPVYTEKRLQYLEASEEERKAQEAAEKAAEEEEKKKNKGGVMAAFRYIFTHKQTRALALVAILLSISTGYTGKYQNMLEVGVTRGVMTAADSALILTVYPIINGIFTLIGGFITDALGRKKSALILGIWAAAGLAVFALGCTTNLDPYITSIAYGISIAGLWSISDMIYFVITSESTPTEQRAAVVGSMQLVGMVGMGLNMVFNNLVTRFAGSMNLPKVLTATYLPLLILSVAILLWKVRETKDVDLDNVQED
ncbi:MAG: MFS transporter [Erysipelotrichaceae bacterium]|nr:MFS transporter [Erysipelotrichaceae bacterium]